MPTLRAGASGRASLPMYNLPEMRAVNAAFWEAMRTELARQGVEDVPTALEFERAPVPTEIERDTLFTQVRVPPPGRETARVSAARTDDRERESFHS